MVQWAPLVPVAQFNIITHKKQSAPRHPILMSYQRRSHRSSFPAGVDGRRKVSIICSNIKVALWEEGDGLNTNIKVGGWKNGFLPSDQCEILSTVFSFVRQGTDICPVFFSADMDFPQQSHNINNIVHFK